MITKPMLAGKCCDLTTLRFPLMITPKLDGIRCLKINGEALSRKFIAQPNHFTRNWIEANFPDWLDGELMVHGKTFAESGGDLGRRAGEPDFRFYAFDYVKDDPKRPYFERMADLAALPDFDRMIKVMPVLVKSLEELLRYEEQWLAEGYEGVMIRDPLGPYKMGRSTEREGWLLKLKRFEDSESEIVGFIEGFTNTNEAQQDAFGRTKRSRAKDGLVGVGTLGSFIVKDCYTGAQFKCGINHTKIPGGIAALKVLWEQRESLLGRIICYKYQPTGVKDKPRFPTFKGFREAWDMPESSEEVQS